MQTQNPVQDHPLNHNQSLPPNVVVPFPRAKFDCDYPHIVHSANLTRQVQPRCIHSKSL